jgi:hypothetical protein
VRPDDGHRARPAPEAPWRGAASTVLVLALASCGIIGVCETPPDPEQSGTAPRPARAPRPGEAATADGEGGPDAGTAEPGEADAEGDATGATAERPPVLPGGLVPGVAAYEKMNVFRLPDYNSPRLGYVRRGAEVMVRGPVDAPDCGDEGQKWYQLDEGGYACAGKGLLIGQRLSQFLYVPPVPDFEAPVPYRYAGVRRSRTPVYKRIPSREETLDVMNYLFPPPETDADAGDGGGGAIGEEDPGIGDEPASETPTGDEPPTSDDLGDLGVEPPLPHTDPLPPAPASADAGTGAGVADVGADVGPEDAGFSDADRELLQSGPRHPMLLRVLMRGFTVALGGMERADGRTWYRTLEGGYVSADDVSPISIAPLRVGIPLDSQITLPVGFVIGRATRVYEENAQGSIQAAGSLEKFAAFGITGEEARGERRLWRTHDGRFVQQGRQIVIVARVDPPRAVGQWDKWIVVDLTEQTLAAFEGTVPVYATLVSTGKEGHETPTGVFRILSKHVSNPMDDFTLGEPYAIDEVPYVMYFERNVALHGAFWHRGFGAVRSHGCVNLAPSDARWIFDWVHPFRPESWHGVYATDTDPGTIVWVRKPRRTRTD